MTTQRRLEIRGLGAVTPLGATWPDTWAALLAGRRSLSDPPFDPALGLSVAVSAIEGLERGWDVDGRGPTARLMRGTAAEAAGEGWSPDIAWAATNHGEGDLVATPAPGAQALTSERFGAGVAHWLGSACTSGLHALWFAWLQASADPSALVVAGDALSATGVAGFLGAGASGGEGCAPLRQGSAGMRVGEGAVALALGRAGAAQRAAILGMAATCDAGHPTHPDPSGVWLEQAIRDALGQAGVLAHEVSAVIAHGTGTRANDTAETLALTRVFGEAVTPIASVKGALGHIMGAAGLLNVAVAAEVCRSGRLPPTLGVGQAYSELPVCGEASTVPPRRPVLALASGFGGNNVAVVVGP